MMTHSLECQQGVGVKFILKIRADKFGINFHYICIESNENFVHNYELGFTSYYSKKNHNIKTFN
jgi:hypothetical protein